MDQRWTPRRQGDAGELSAITWFVGVGAVVSLPPFDHPGYDLIADFGDRVERAQVKTSIFWRMDRWEITLCTRVAIRVGTD